MFLVYAGWPAANAALSLVGIVIGLGALTPNARLTTALALVATLIAGIAAGILEFVVLDGVDDFVLLAIGLAPLVIGAALPIASPNRMVSALGRIGLIFAAAMFSPSNPPTYDAQSYLFSFVFFGAANGLLLATQFLIPPVSEERRIRWLLLSARREFAQLLSRDLRHQPEEEMFRDAVRIGQILAAGGAAPNTMDAVEEVLSRFDQSSILRLFDDKRTVLAEGASAELAEQVRAAFDKREPQSLRAAALALRKASPSDPATADLGAALMLASYHIEAASGRRAQLGEAA
jgi:hypothetical protein